MYYPKVLVIDESVLDNPPPPTQAMRDLMAGKAI